MYLLGIDIGTTKIAGVLLFHNTFVKVLSENNDSALPSIHSWEHLQDPHIILKTAFKIIDQLKREINEPVTSIGISGQMHGFLYVTKEGNACSPLFTWQDSRAAIPLEQDSPVTAQSFIQERTGHHIFPGYALATHYYNHYKKLVPENAYGIVSIGGYLAMKLSRSAEACIDPSEAASFGLYDIKEQTFVFREIERLYGNIDFLPKLVPFHHRAGFLKDGTPVFSSLGDNQASFYGAMQEQQNANLLLNLGTSGQISFLLESLPSPESPQQNLKSLSGMELRPYPNGYLAVGATLSGGKSFDILAELFTEVLAFFGHQTSKAEVYRTIHKQVLQWHEHGQKLSLEQSLHVQPYFYGTREQPDAKGAILNIGAANLRVLPLLYGFTEAMVRELHELWLASGLANTHSVCSNIVGSGNAIRRNPMIKPIIENMFGAKLIISNIEEEAACGAAWYAAQYK